MKRFRIFYYIVMLVALLYGLYSGNRVCFLLFFMQLTTMAVALALNLWTVSSFSYVQTLSEKETEKGRTVTLHLGIYNDKPFPFTHMKVHIMTPAPEDCRDIWVNLAPKQETSFDFTLSLPYRGEYQAGMTRLDIQDLFGILPMHIDMRWLSYYRPQSLLVYPRLIPFRLPASSRSFAAGTGTLSGSLPAGHEEFSHLRSFTPGDPMSRIHWNSPVKPRQLLTRQYTDPVGESCLIFIDTRSLSGDSEKISDRITECAATLLYAHLAQEDPTRLACPDSEYPALAETFSLSDFHRCHQWLALLPFRMTDEEACAQVLRSLTDVSRRERIYILGAGIRSAYLDVLKNLPSPCFYWVWDVLPEQMPPAGESLHIASFYEKEILSFLQDQLGGGAP